MKQLLVYFAFLLPLAGSSQALWQTYNDPSVMKKKGVQKIRVYNKDNDAAINMRKIPYITAYYDREGRITKTVILYPHVSDSVTLWEVRETTFDTLARIMLEKTNYSLAPDADQTSFIAYGDVKTYSYEGDSVLMSVDSNRYNNKLSEIIIEKQVWHWEKTSPPNPRPLLWPDSICTGQIRLLKHIDFYYPDETSLLPGKVDSIWNVQHVSWAFQNNKINGKETTKYYRPNGVVEYETISAYTLNQTYDTARRITTGRDFSEVNGEFIYEPAKFYRDTIETYYTQRKGNQYFILVNEGRFDRYKESVEKKFTTQDPWSNEDIMPFFNEYPIFVSQSFFPLESQLKYGERIEIIYWQ
jgi:hypothetical protein